MTPRSRRAPAVQRPTVELLERRALLTTVGITAQLPAVSTVIGAQAATVDLSADFTGADVPPNTVFFKTSDGLIPVELTPTATPLTVANFLSYVTAGSYDGSFVHRSVHETGLDIWQGGSYTATATSDGSVTTSAITAGSPVTNEYADSHPNVRGTIAMAKVDGDPNSATDGWFFNVADNSTLLDAENGGFTTFGTVIGNGLSVMDDIAGVPTYDLGSLFDTIPLTGYSGSGAVAASNLVTINSVRTVAAYAVTSDDPAVVSASVDGDGLTYTPGAAGTAHLTVTATGVDGSTAVQTFAVTVVDPTIGLLPAVKTNRVPASYVIGNKVDGSLGLTLTNTAGSIDKGTNTVRIYAVPFGSSSLTGATLLTTAKVKTKLLPGATQKFTVPVKQLPPSSGTYTLLAQTTNVAGTVVTATAGPTVTVAAPVVTLAVTAITPLPGSVVAGRSVTFAVTFTNTGNVDGRGSLMLAVGLSTDGTSVAVPVASSQAPVRIKFGGKPVVVHIHAKVPVGTAAGAYQLLATFLQGNSAGSAVGTTDLTVVAA